MGKCIPWGLFCTIFVLLQPHAFALTADRSKPVHFASGHASFNQKTGEGIYSQGVSIDQGTTHLRATDAQTVMNTEHQLTRATAHGNTDAQAHFWTSTSTEKPPLHAYADTIAYYPIEHRLELTGDARIIQGDNIISAPVINYDTKAERLITKANASKKEGTLILIRPEKKHE